ncbi:sigma-70 family RNA polymerase sigma factor [Virgisporangium aliadipatigenens]|uniref:sigma-70 family RNA polymerase sigma factor n=1 Tax=Virgisporangium aliadipatigenens TaxID=741659 RepID=UPI00194347DA|nr:sigma-70 family RNA polymerase sigma factor [Virgisporangium aliadipatigenens]
MVTGVEVSDEALLAGMAAGDQEAAGVFVRRFKARVYGLAIAIVGLSTEAEEIAQDTFLRAWRYAGAYDPRRGSVATWLLTITRNASVDVLRIRREVPVDPGSLLAALSLSYDGGTEQLADALRLRSALAEIPREQATSVVLSVFFGLTAAEIASRDGIPLGTAKTRIRSGLLRLRDKLGVTDG